MCSTTTMSTILRGEYSVWGCKVGCVAALVRTAPERLNFDLLLIAVLRAQ